MTSEVRGKRWFTYYLIATTILCGALVMVIEVLGSRVLGPFFGVSLFVWTSLITVTLVALAAGYAIGGRWSDRCDSPDALYLILIAAGLLVLLVPWLKPLVIKATLPLGLRWGALASALFLFGPALFLLGCVSPWVIKLAAREMQHLGKTVGAYYAASTAGSVAGTIVTGFFLIPFLGVDRIFWLAGALLLALGAGYFAIWRGKWIALAAFAPLMALPPANLPQATMPGGTRASVVHSRDSFYGNLKVVEYRKGAMHTRELVIDGLVQGGIDLASALSVYEYPYLLQALPVAMHTAGRRCLVIGLGAGVVPRWYQARGIATDVVDIDPDVVALAHKYFGLDTRTRVFVEDARAFLGRGNDRYDYLILDVFNGDTTPGHLLSLEAMHLARARLNDKGVVAINLIGSLGAHAEMTHAVINTLRTVFANVAAYPLFAPNAGDAAGNLVLIAYDGAPRLPDAGEFGHMAIHPMAQTAVRPALRSPLTIPPALPGAILTDNFNPIDVRDLWLKEWLRENILASTHIEILLN
jgi:spermidine synthase